ncbi:MAG: A/G-specific adenine glycosylase [Lewinellaceae bacterium]|nr:A/G-specific adenine glycosylase [Lewinellaceae bacterium]
MDNHQFFSQQLMAWFAKNHRPLPWKGEKDPYKIWLSEIILQQTRVEQGLPYYQRFVSRYPTIQHLADAPEDEVLKLWEGLGYYSRAKNLHATARSISNELNGIFPGTYNGIRSLKGVGDYTAAAIASFAFDLPHAVIDGNVYRVLSRFFGIATPTDTSAGKKEFATLAQQLINPARPGDYNQAIMDFGATHCTPRQAKCKSCPMQEKCVACQSGQVATLPVKSKTPERKERFFIYLVADFQGTTWVKKRSEKDIWHNLYEFPLLETDRLTVEHQRTEQLVAEHFFPEGLPEGACISAVSKPYRQTLTHRVVTALFCEITFADDTPAGVFERAPFEHCMPLLKTAMRKNIAVPRLIDWYLQEKVLTLRLI